MEKMGWSKGKGLGMKEDGRVQHISLKLKVSSKYWLPIEIGRAHV